MRTYHRLCIKTVTITAKNGDSFTIKSGVTYLTSELNKKNEVCVFGQYWVWMPERYFVGAQPFT